MKWIDFDKVDFYPRLIKDYLSGDLKSKGIIDWEYSKSQLELNKSRAYSSETRKAVAQVLSKQYANFELTAKEQENLKLFGEEKTFTITTGHQLVLLGGPLFFYTKIFDVIQLARDLSTPSNPVLPMFWMASEDHDYEEIAKVNLFGKVITCPGENKGPVGRISKEHFKEFLSEVNQVLGEGEQFQNIKSIINNAFETGANLAEITRIFVRALFKDECLLIIDGDDKDLKSLFAKVMSEEMNSELAFNASKDHIENLSKDYKIQVNPREINLFYIEDEVRLRIVKTSTGYSTPNAEYSWSSSQMEELLQNSPEKISPNVILRPVYQEILLPNLAYVGGAGEIAYWLELKPVFEAFKIPFPTPLVRKANFILPKKLMVWLADNHIDLLDVFGDLDLLLNSFSKAISGNAIDFAEEEKQIKALYQSILVKGKAINPQLEKVVLGEEKRALGALKNVEKRFLNADKQNYEQQLNKLKNIHGKFFPNGVAMERVNSYIPEIAADSNGFNQELKESGSIFDKKITVIVK